MIPTLIPNRDPARAAQTLCRELSHGTVAPPAAARPAASWLSRFRRAVPREPLDEFRDGFARDPRDPLALWRFARFLDAEGFEELTSVPLTILHVVRPGDPAPAAALARVLLARARRRDRAPASRLKDYDRVSRYASRAGAAARGEGQAAAVEATLLRGRFAA